MGIISQNIVAVFFKDSTGVATNLGHTLFGVCAEDYRATAVTVVVDSYGESFIICGPPPTLHTIYSGANHGPTPANWLSDLLGEKVRHKTATAPGKMHQVALNKHGTSKVGPHRSLSFYKTTTQVCIIVLWREAPILEKQ